MSRRLATILTATLVALSAAGVSLHAQELQVDPSLAPLNPPPVAKPAAPIVLKGGVRTLDQAMVQERDAVDWYGWYLSCRDYLLQTGGFQCPLGSTIHFYRSGRLDTNSRDPLCRASVMSKHFPLPENTRIPVLALPIRRGADPPATPEEIQRRTRG
ncbi:MAG: hypothetical protein IPK79_10495 [Vampirovibrionales bacterium]|nr:hypothetical protein [Vampirovibrionales bacterium]